MEKLDDAAKGRVDMRSWLDEVLDASTFKALQRQKAPEQADPQLDPPAEDKKVFTLDFF